MWRECAIILYLSIFKCLFSFFKIFPQKKKTIFVTYFGENAFHIIEELGKRTNENIVIVKTKHSHVDFKASTKKRIIDLSRFSITQWLQMIYHLATSKKVIIDTYYGFLAVTEFRENVECIQLWHAAGAIKKFGLEDMSVPSRSKRAKERFKKVYNRMDKVIIGSRKMGDIYQKSFGVHEKKLVPTGIPRTDFFFQEEKKSHIKNTLYEKYPNLKSKRIILYAPTFRDEEMYEEKIALDISKLEKELGEEYILLLKLHPVIKNRINIKSSNFIFDMSDYGNVNHLLLITNILITDYSSIPFEYAFLEKPMIFFAYDLERYEKTRGIWEEYESMVPAPIARTTDDIIDIIKDNSFDIEKVKSFKKMWNEYSDGSSSKRFVEVFYQKELTE